MPLSRLQVTDFRCLQSATLELDSHFTLISGPNASGKTSLLEALYVLGRGRSFRSRRLEHLIRRGRERFVVFGALDSTDRTVGLGVEGSHSGMRAQVSGERVSSLAELALQFPVQIIDPEIHRLIEEGPSRRRRFIDWGVFHVEHRFVQDWQRFQIALRQRNAALKSRQPDAAIFAWEPELLKYGEVLTAARVRYVERLAEAARPIVASLLGQELRLTYRTGWARDLSFESALRQSWEQDRHWGSTQVGPQRAELVIKLNEVAVKDHVSRGQQKLLAAALALAQLRLFPADASAQPALLLDDPAAELDSLKLGALIAEVASRPIQLVVTALHSELSAWGTPGRAYRLEAGRVLDD